MVEWYQTRPFVKNLVWFKKYHGSRKLKRYLKMQNFWLKKQNFGDYLSRIVVAKLALHCGFKKRNYVNRNKKLLAIGSILHFAKEDSLVWGTGVNGKIDPGKHKFKRLDVRMVRGPLTLEFLKNRNIVCDEIFGDPAMLLPVLFPGFNYNPKPGKIILIPNLNDLSFCVGNTPRNIQLVSPLVHWKRVLWEILSSELVITSSLHGVILCEAYRVPLRFVQPVGGETLFKYRDYFLGTGRDLNKKPSKITDGITIKSGITMPETSINLQPLIDAFPRDLFE